MCDDLTLQKWRTPVRSEEMMSPTGPLAEKNEASRCRDSDPCNEADQTLPMRLVKLIVGSFVGHQTFPRTTKPQLYSESCRKKDVNFPCLDLLEVSSGDFSLFGQLFLSYAATHPLSANICAKNPDSGPFFAVKRHGILHRGDRKALNDTIHRKLCEIFLAKYWAAVKISLFSRTNRMRIICCQKVTRNIGSS